MQNKKGNVTVLAIIVVVVAITASVITWMFAKNSQPTEQPPIVAQPVARIPSEQQPTPTPTPTQVMPTSKDMTQSIFDMKNWQTYTIKIFNIAVNVPRDWKAVFPEDGRLAPMTENEFESGYAIISSPNKVETMSFMIKASFDDANSNCQKQALKINNLRVNKIICNDSLDDAIPGKINYEFIDRDLVIVLNKKSETIDKIISSIK